MKRATYFPLWAIILLLTVLGTVSAADAAVSVTKGPYLQNVTPTSMVIMWQTTEPGDSRVDFGLTSGYTQYVYDAALKQIHEINVTGLNPNTLYHYRVTSNTGAQSVSSGDNPFRTAVTAGTPFRFAVYGDSRSQPTIHSAVVEAITTSAPRFVLHTGDLTSNGTIDSYWQTEFFNPIASLLTKTPLFPSLGNHENNSLLYYTYFDLPNGGGDYNERWYSFDYGSVRFIVLDTDTSYLPSSAQYNWLVNELQTTAAEWIFIVHHHPAYSSGSHGSELNVQAYLVPLYTTYGVDMVFNGHDHHYERSYKDGVYYIVTGGGGAPLYSPNLTPNSYQQYAEATYHHCTIDINGTTATFRAIHNDGNVFDTITLSHLSPPVSDFSANPTSGKAPLTVAFTDRSTGNPNSWSWDFSDGATSTAQHPSHPYTSPGTYSVSLTVSNTRDSDMETKINYITVTSAGPLEFTCTSADVNIGVLQSGNHVSVHASDDAYLVVASAKSGSKQTEQVTYSFATGLTGLSSLSVTVEGKVSAGSQPQSISLYNYARGKWELKSSSALTPLDSTVQFNVNNPGNYISGGTVQVRVKTGGGRTGYSHLTERVSITAGN